MNRDIENIFDKAEGRYLADEEIQAIRNYAAGMPERFAAAKRLGQLEESIAAETLQRFLQKYPEHGHEPEVREKAGRDFRLTLHYVAHCVARDDIEYFREAFAEWIAETICGTRPAVVIADAYQMLKTVTMEKAGADGPAIEPYLDCYIREIEKWR